MKEDFLQAVWAYRLFDNKSLSTVGGQSVEIINPGSLNRHAGPDFFDARIRIGGTLWAGNVEVHIRGDEWRQHGHDNDRAYDNVILHVVLDAGEGPAHLPVLELGRYINRDLIARYEAIIESMNEVPCQPFLPDVDPVIFEQLLERMMVNRLEKKCETIRQVMEQTAGSWEEAFYRRLAANFGFSTNSLPFEMLAAATPINVLAKHRHNFEQVQALLFGQAGFLEGKPEDGYHSSLKKEYLYLKHKLSVEPMKMHLWKFMRTRPANFPTIRISQFARLIHQSNSLLSHCLELDDIHELRNLLNVRADSYWNNHSRFGQASGEIQAGLGDHSVNLIAINTVIPFMFAYGQAHAEEHLCDKALRFLCALPAEENRITRMWNALGRIAHNAGQTQGMIELFKYHCLKKECLKCGAGIRMLSRLKQ